MLHLAALTVARSDFGRMSAFYDALKRRDDYRLSLAAGAGHHDPTLGQTISEVRLSGHEIDHVLPEVEGDASVQSASVLLGISSWMHRCRPDAFIILGDRYEMLAAAQAAVLKRIPIIHIGGGHLTLGAIDERIRHAITKLSSLHLVASEACRQRVIALHEDPLSIHVTGAPELDILVSPPSVTRTEFYDHIGLDPTQPFGLVTLHPETNVSDLKNVSFAAAALEALLATSLQVLITSPCADPGNEPFIELCKQVESRKKGSRYVQSLGMSLYVAAMNYAQVMIGNSSSGIIEAASLGLPVVNIGDRQALRDRAINVVDCPFDKEQILRAISQATSPRFIESCRGIINPYGNGNFVSNALSVLANVQWPLPINKNWCY